MTAAQNDGAATGTLALGELRDAWVEELSKIDELTCDELRSRLRERGLRAKGDDRKAEIRNIHSAATNDPRIAKVRPGVFALRRRRD